MRFSTSILAAGLTASVFAAPITTDDYDDCNWEPVSQSASSTPEVEPSLTSTLVSAASTTFSINTSAISAVSSIIVASTSTNAASTTPATQASSSAVSSTINASTSVTIPTSLPTSAAVSSVVASASAVALTSSSTAVSSSSASGKFKWFGADESGAEFGSAIPGVLGTDYTFPLTSTIGILMGKGMNAFRIPFLIERLAPGTMTAALDTTYLSGLQTVVSYITSNGGYAVLDAHNFGRYAGSVFTSTSDFQTFWTNVATEFKSNANVIFDCNNEFHDEPSNALVASLNQACIDGIRAAGATSQYIFVEGTSYTGAWTWVSSGNGDAMVGLTDTEDKIVYEMHQYLDSDGSGTSATCVSSTIGAERIAAATAWLKANNKMGVIGEYAGGANADCESAVTGMLDAMLEDSDVWMGAIWWGAGPWWGDYMYSMEPSTGAAYVAYSSLLAKYT